MMAAISSAAAAKMMRNRDARFISKQGRSTF
jgi:hypothetical protein